MPLKSSTIILKHVLLLYESTVHTPLILYEANKHGPIRANPITGMRGTREIGLFNSLYRNMLMQDNDSLIARHYGTYMTEMLL